MGAIAFEYPAEIEAIRGGIKTFIRSEVIPRHERHAALLNDDRQKYDASGRYVPDVLRLIREVRMAAAKAGYYAMSAPASLGGGGLGLVAYFAAWQDVFHTCGSEHWLGHWIISHWAKGPSPVLEKMSPRAKAEILPGLLSGERALCFGLSEPGAGSDAAAIQTRATPDGDGWRLTGRKIWTTNSPYADYVIVFAVTDPDAAARRRGGISTFLVPTNAPGFTIESIIKMYGHIGGDEGILVFDDVRVEPHQLVGEPNKGFAIGLLGVSLGRMYNMGRAVGLARWALEKAVEYTKVRHTFGKPISEYQGVTFPLAESAMEIHAAHLMSLNCAQLLDRGQSAVKEMSMAKAFAVEAGVRAIDRAIQTHGAMGFTNELGLTEAYAAVRKVNVADGSNEIMRRTIAQCLLKGDTDL